MLQSRSSSAWVSDPGMRPIVAWGLKPTFANCQHSQGLIDLFLLPTSWKNLERGRSWHRLAKDDLSWMQFEESEWHMMALQKLYRLQYPADHRHPNPTLQGAHCTDPATRNERWLRYTSTMFKLCSNICKLFGPSLYMFDLQLGHFGSLGSLARR